MKPLLLLAAFAVSLTAAAQSAVTLDQGNVSLSLGKHIFKYKDSSGVTAPKAGNNQIWDYSKLDSTDTTSVTYTHNTNSAFSSSALVNTTTQYLNSSASYNVSYYYDEDSKGFFSPGASTDYQVYSLAGFTGNSSDSFYVLKQDIKYRENMINFPATTGSSWTSDFREIYNFLITYSPFYNKTPAATHITVHEDNNVTGWGQLKLPGTGGNSINYQVLMVKSSFVGIDSFFLNNKPAPPLVLSGFGMKQGAKNYNYQINFYTPGSALPIMTFDYGKDSTYSNLSTVTYETNVKTDLKQQSVELSGMKVYPNPAQGEDMHVSFNKAEAGQWTLNVTNMLGQIVKTMKVNGTGSMNVPLDLGNQYSGIYNVSMLDGSGTLISSEKISLVK
jgi:hypothetical protein